MTVNIIDIVQDSGVILDKAGDNLFRGLCPFHHDQGTPNFTVFVDTQSYYCFACGAGGDILDFVMRFYNLSYSQAQEKVYGQNYLLYMLNNIKEKKINYKHLLNKTISNIAYVKFKNHNYRLRVLNILHELDFKLRDITEMSKFEFNFYYNYFIKQLSFLVNVV